MDASPDGSLVLFRDTGVYDPLYLLKSGTVHTIADPTHEAGTPMSGRLSSDTSFVVFDDAGQLWRYDVNSADVARLSSLGNVLSYVFITSTSLDVLTVTDETPFPPTKLWNVDVPSSKTSAIGDRTDTQRIFATAKGLVVLVDQSRQHDYSDVALYLVAPDGSEAPFYSAGASAYVAISPDGNYVALSRGEAGAEGSWLVALATGETQKLSSAGVVRDFSPDSQHVRLDLSGGNAASYSLDATLESTVQQGSRSAWVGL